MRTLARRTNALRTTAARGLTAAARPRLNSSALKASSLLLTQHQQRRTLSSAAAAPAAPVAATAPAAEPTVTPRKFTHSATPKVAVGAGAAASVSTPSIQTGGDYALPHPVWAKEYLETITVTHSPPKTLSDRVALALIKTMRFNFDVMSGYLFRPKTEKMWLNRIIFLESVAGVPGSIGATIRHLASLRQMRRDHGWIHTLLEEAENERIHLLTAIELRAPGPLFRAAILLTQGVFFNFFFAAYLVHPRFCHRVVGYLEEEAVKTYTDLLKQIDTGKLPAWERAAAPDIAKAYWRLPATATMRDVIANIRADETHHRDVNHTFADIGTAAPNPYPPGH